MSYRTVPCSQWGGLDSSQPALALSSNSFRQITNWIINKGRLMPFPTTNAFDVLPNGEPLMASRTFQDGLNNFHTVLIGQSSAYYYGPGNVFTQIVSTDINNPLFATKTNAPWSIEVMLNRLFFCNGQNPLYYIIGDGNFYKAGDVPGGCYFLGKLASHLIMINTVEPDPTQFGSVGWPARLRWSASGNPFEWDATIDPTAGFADIADVEDQLTGWATLGLTGFAFRNNGISSVSATGNSSLPFTIENFSIGPTGIGVSDPFTLAVYGTFCCFKALDDIYYFDTSGPQKIGGKAKKQIFKDIFNASSSVNSTIFGTLGNGVDYLTYWLWAPQSNDSYTSVWIYHFDDQTWVNEHLPYGAMRSIGNLALT